MASRNDVISVDELWVAFDSERRNAWDGVESEPGTPDWNIAAGKIDVINNICGFVYKMNAAERSDSDNAEPPIWKSGESLVHTDYADGHGETTLEKWAAWVCPKCEWFVGEQFRPKFLNKPHNQSKCNFCPRCGQRIDWAAAEKEADDGRSR